MADFSIARDITLPHEGGLTRDKRGGWTKYGISQTAYPNLDIKSLTQDQAIAIYKRDYWNPINLDLMSYQPLANQIFDIAINSGVGGAKRLLRDTLTQLQIPPMTASLSPSDIDKLNKYDGQKINNKLAKIRADFYGKLAEKDPDNKQYLIGWLKRATSFISSEPGKIAGSALLGFFFIISAIIYFKRKG